jgi:hypothetical protein
MDTSKHTLDPLKRQAKHLLLTGDLERYLRLLGRIHALRTSLRPAIG